MSLFVRSLSLPARGWVIGARAPRSDVRSVPDVPGLFRVFRAVDNPPKCLRQRGLFRVFRATLPCAWARVCACVRASARGRGRARVREYLHFHPEHQEHPEQRHEAKGLFAVPGAFRVFRAIASNLQGA